MNNFKKLKIWILGREIASETYKLTMKLNRQEQFVFAGQIARAAVSIPSNIAEGNSRRSQKDFARFIEIALGSAYELETHLLIMQDIYVGDEALVEKLLVALEEEQRMLHGLLRKLSNSL